VCTTGCAEPPTLPGPVSSAVQGVDQTLGTNVSGSSGGLTGRVEDTARDTLNNVGGAVGSPGVGDRVAETGNRLAGGLGG
jgi:hypothetical protein